MITYTMGRESISTEMKKSGGISCRGVNGGINCKCKLIQMHVPISSVAAIESPDRCFDRLITTLCGVSLRVVNRFPVRLNSVGFQPIRQKYVKIFRPVVIG